MRISLLPILLLYTGLFVTISSDAQTYEWTWVSGNNTPGAAPVYGLKGIFPTAVKPGARTGSSMWKDASGNLWLFGGKSSKGDLYNDLWKYTPGTGLWAWVSGDNASLNAGGSNSPGSYGTKGVANSGNIPPARSGQNACVDGSGNFWFFGGQDDAGLLNDLWMYNPTAGVWTWVGGDNTPNSQGIYGVQGTPANNNKPGGRSDASAWIDASGNFWVFGGTSLNPRGNPHFVNDLWKFDHLKKQWTWMSGSSMVDAQPDYGIEGQADQGNTPGARSSASGMVDGSGNFWLFGGMGISYSGVFYGSLNDLWKYVPTTGLWTWVSGDNTGNQSSIENPATFGNEDPTNKPGGRDGQAGWIDASDNIYIFGGEGYDASDNYGYLDDAWIYKPALNQWLWSHRGKTANSPNIYGPKGVTRNFQYMPGGRVGAAGTVDAAGNGWVFGGTDNSGNSYNDIWKVSPPPMYWTWMAGDNTVNNVGVYGALGGVPVGVRPGKRMNQSAWKDAAGNFWVFGGADNTGHVYNDLWEYNPTLNLWAWVGGDNTADNPGDYGVQGTASADVKPGARSGQSGWSDAAGNVWIFGGAGIDGTGAGGYLDDLWMFNPATGQWTWESGNNTVNKAGFYDVSPDSHPGGRTGQCVWTDWLGHFWIFGGQGYDLNGHPGYLNDLWIYYPGGGWGMVYMAGKVAANSPNVYGTKGVATDANTPGGRFGACGWSYGSGSMWSSGNFYIYGGQDNKGNAYSDLWMFSPGTDQWTWIGGDNITNQSGFYGTPRIGSTGNNPGAKFGQSSWIDATGTLWMYGGQDSYQDYYDDLWKYVPTTKQWAWMAGNNSPNQPSVYGTQGVAGMTNQPGARSGQSAWMDASGTIWLFGGLETLENTPDNDLWNLRTFINLPVENVVLAGIPGVRENQLTWQTTDELNSSAFEIERSVDGANFSAIGSVSAVGSGNNSYSYTDVSLPVSANYFYRLKMEDRDGKWTYSQTIVLHTAADHGFAIYPNPAHNGVTLQMKDDSLLNTPVKLLTIGGILIQEYTIVGQQQLIDLSRLSAGVYLLQLADGTVLKILKE